MPERRETASLPVGKPVWIALTYRNGAPPSFEFERRLGLLPGEYSFKALVSQQLINIFDDGTGAMAIIIYGTSPTPTLLEVRAALGASVIAMYDESEILFPSFVGLVLGSWHSVTSTIGGMLDPIQDRVDELIARGMAYPPDTAWVTFLKMLKTVGYVGLGVGGLVLFIRLMQATARKKSAAKRESGK